MTRAGPSQRPGLDGAPIAPRVTLPRRKHITQVPGARSKFSLRISCLFLQISVHRGYRESLNLRGQRSSETVLLIVCPKSPLDWRLSSSLETIAVRRTRQGNTGCQCQLRMVVSQLSGQTFDDSDQILQVCCDTMKFSWSPQETKTSNTCPFSQFVADKASTRVRIQKKELWVLLHPITREKGNDGRTVRLETLPRIPFPKA